MKIYIKKFILINSYSFFPSYQTSFMNLKLVGSFKALKRFYLYFKCHAVFEILELYMYPTLCCCKKYLLYLEYNIKEIKSYLIFRNASLNLICFSFSTLLVHRLRNSFMLVMFVFLYFNISTNSSYINGS